ncbi:Nucleoside diphosphate-linked moiety X motif 6 [Branchiostoma belcheri]|nr:Nucleoside diphosphate-linked moiety X motif 6 [Branchiostoma belcheri]
MQSLPRLLKRPKLLSYTWRAKFHTSCPSQQDVLMGTVDKWGGVTVDLGSPDCGLEGTYTHTSLRELDAFAGMLRNSLKQWKMEGKKAVWLKVPILQSRFVPVAASQGFQFHHADKDYSMLTAWLPAGSCKIPHFASHQVGVAGCVLREDTKEVLVVQDRNRETSHMWKLPGGLSDPGEYFGETAVREVFEETGIQSEFQSILTIRQLHNYPGAFGKSDLYIVCRLRALGHVIDHCTEEIIGCKWMDVSELATSQSTSLISTHVARLVLYGFREGFDKVDIGMKELPAVFRNMTYKLYHRQIPDC